MNYKKTVVFTKKEDGPIYINGDMESYIVYDYDKLEASHLDQSFYYENKSRLAKGRFNKIVLDHGIKPRGSSYEYLIYLHNSGKDNLNKKKLILDKKPYDVLQVNGRAHILEVKNENRINYVIFEPYKTELKNDILISTSTNLIVSIKQKNEHLLMSLTNPSIKYNAEGNIVCTETFVKLKGHYDFIGNSKAKTHSYSKGKTLIGFSFCEGEEIAISLKKQTR
jgi:hypothetical protein